MTNRAAGLALLVTMAIVALLAGVVVLAGRIDWTFGDPSVAGNSTINNTISIFGAVALFVVLVVLVAILIDDVAAGREISPLYLPILALIAVLAVVVGYVSTGALDSLRGERWMWRFEPEVRMLLSLFYLGVFLAASWFMGVVLYRRGMGGRWVFGVFAAIVAVSALTVLVAVRV